MRIAVLGPGGVGGLIAGALARHGQDVAVIARESTAERISTDGLRVRSVTLGEFLARPRVLVELEEPDQTLIVATKAAGLASALERIHARPAMALPLLNGLDHLTVLRERLPGTPVLAGAIRIEADRPEPGVVLHTSHFLLVNMASADPRMAGPMGELAGRLAAAGIPARVQDSEAHVMWSKLVRLNALACTTSAHDRLLGEIRSTPQLRADLLGAIEEGARVAQADGASEVRASVAIEELEQAHETLGSSMQRDIAAGRPPELDEIAGSVLRAGARHGLPCPTIERLVGMIVARSGAPAPRATG